MIGAEKKCGELDLIAYASGELTALEAQRMRAHISHCKSCASLMETYDEGLRQARSWQPEAPPEHLALLNKRLDPYYERRTNYRALLLQMSFAFVSLLLAVGVGYVAWLLSSAPPPKGAPGPSSIATVVEAPPANQQVAAVPLRAEDLKRQRPAPHLRMLTSPGWDGSVAGDQGDLSVTMSDGFALFGFEGGAGRSGQRRRLRIWTPTALVEVVGTRFYVEVSAAITHVGVARGRVRVLTRSGDTVLRKSDRVALDNDGERIRAGEAVAAAFLDDPFLLPDFADASRARRTAAVRRAVRAKAAKAASESGPDIFTRLRHAEQLAQRGEHRQALAAYAAIRRDPRAAPYHDMCLYEIARLRGFALNRPDLARSAFRALVRQSRGEVARQAALALCELDLNRDPCAAARCLRALTAETDVDFDVKREAQRLLQNWRLRKEKCQGG